jgi:Skp family chaperone for outer membrane proteins
MSRSIPPLATVLSILLAAAPAVGQTTATKPSAAPGTASGSAARSGAPEDFGGPLIANVCLLSREQVLSQSLAGQAAITRLKQLSQQAQSSFDAQRHKLEADAKALQSQGAGMAPAQAQHRQQQLQSRAQALQGEGGQTQRELEATRAKALTTIDAAAQPIVQDVYKTKGCGLLLNRDAVLGGNMANDLTADVIKGLDAKMSTITFEREHLPAGAASR